MLTRGTNEDWTGHYELTIVLKPARTRLSNNPKLLQAHLAYQKPYELKLYKSTTKNVGNDLHQNVVINTST